MAATDLTEELADPKWDDVEPVPPPHQRGDAFYISPPSWYTRLFGLFGALVAKDEISARAVDLCNLIIRDFTSHYTAWWYKFHVLERLGYDLEAELDRIAQVLRANNKSYQAWHYRQWLVDRSPHDETAFLTETFERDAKNFHGWSFAIWYAARWDRGADIFALAVAQIASDCRNNSAWNARKTVGEMIGVDPLAEFEAAVDSLRVVGKNEAACNFLLAIVWKAPQLTGRVRELAEELLAKKPDNRHAMGLLLAVAEEKGEVERYCDELMKIDPVRIPYYTLVRQGVLKF
jgi:protein farnesyltransferase/geranylgeranyltransferase type-1 subunit alpha